MLGVRAQAERVLSETCAAPTEGFSRADVGGEGGGIGDGAPSVERAPTGSYAAAAAAGPTDGGLDGSNWMAQPV